ELGDGQDDSLRPALLPPVDARTAAAHAHQPADSARRAPCDPADYSAPETRFGETIGGFAAYRGRAATAHSRAGRYGPAQRDASVLQRGCGQRSARPGRPGQSAA